VTVAAFLAGVVAGVAGVLVTLWALVRKAWW